ncbi:spondin-1-like isoform X1 [Varroa jacobsoni]|uniref:spondin-1-like isoform X1 n=1 Tax=Varroa jacobsoni TaxID=62625 RepID=UPI000BF65B88|nr:spondin-1-like isoform X1 [Varroa jacobsoni]
MASSRKRDAPALDSPTVYVACAVIFAALVSSTVALGDTGPTAQFVTLNSGEYDNDSPVEPPPGDSGNRAGSSGAMSITKERLALDCNRIPSGAIAERTPGSGGFSIRLSGSPKNYVPREGYTVSIQAPQDVLDSSSPKFVAFTLVVESSDPNRINPDVGAFQLFGDALSRYSDECPQAVEQASPVAKAEVTVLWTAPPAAGAGCVSFKAAVVEYAERWFMDDGNLTKELCPEEQDNADEQPPVLEECCACDEAKYEMTFEGLWSRYTHPKGYPDNEWLTHFSDIIGASHAADFKMWEYDGFASEGVRSVAEHGATKKLEAELKAQSGKIRTIIKARGLWYPNVNGKTFAVFRVDRKHHVMSALSMLGPSPDWLVGVSSLELCLKNCSWLASKTINLYPWDAGTSDGLSYVVAQREASSPQQRIHKITSSFPADPDSPFFDPTGTPMKPVAKLTITRQRLYEKVSCDNEDNEPSNGESRHHVISISEDSGFEGSNSSMGAGSSASGSSSLDACAVGPWGVFGPCSASCGISNSGSGVRVRTRAYLRGEAAVAAYCRVQLIESAPCEVECTNGISCEATPWTEWAECSATCGKGVRLRRRKYKHHMARRVCSVDLMEKEQCEAAIAYCVPENISPACAVSPWSEWSSCSASCGTGFRVRTRGYINRRQAVIARCGIEQLQRAVCRSKVECGDNEKKGSSPLQFHRPAPLRRTLIRGGPKASHQLPGGHRGGWMSGGSSSSLSGWGGAPLFEPPVTVVSEEGDPVDCVLTRWSEWGACTKTCGLGRRERRRMVKKNPAHGGKSCPKKLVQRRRCRENPPCRSGIKQHSLVTSLVPYADSLAIISVPLVP